MRRRSLTVAATFAVLALIAAALIAGATPGRDGAPPLLASSEPAPPPAFCRVPPSEGAWPDISATRLVPDLTAYQDYRAGLGIDGTARGEGVRIADVEYEWRPAHVELAERGLPPGADTGLPVEYRSNEHGTAVLGVIGASDDGRGVSGLAPDAALRPVSPFTNAGYDAAEGVRRAAAGLGPGDVLLVELQGMTAGESARLTPIEFLPAVRDAIREAVDRGIVVVEPAGNGDLDVGTLAPGAPWLAGPGAPGHSGALMVGGGGGGWDDSGAGDLQRVPGSNHGARVDLQGYGAGVLTSGYGDRGWGATGDRSYTACFDGTSSAAATVAAAAALVQGAEVARDGTPLTPAELRALLVATGTPQTDSPDGLIGPRPHVARAIAALDTAAPAPPPDGPPAPPEAPAAPAVPAPAAPAAAHEPAAAAAAPAASIAGRRPAGARSAARPRVLAPVRRLRAAVDRRARTVVLALPGLARRATVRVNGRRVAVRRGRAVLRGRMPKRLIVVVRAPRRAGVVYRAARFRVAVPARGAPKVVRLAHRG